MKGFFVLKVFPLELYSGQVFSLKLIAIKNPAKSEVLTVVPLGLEPRTT